jgi:hypothetical protein
MTVPRIWDAGGGTPTRRRLALALAALAALAAVVGCAPRPLVARAIRARGGPLSGLVRDVEARVHTGFPGTWQWRTAFLVPDRYAWTIHTRGEPDHYLYDGRTLRAFVGGRLVAVDAGSVVALRTHARFTAVVNLDALLLPGVHVQPLAPDALPPGAVAGLDVRFADDGSAYRLAFDGRDLLVRVEGPLALPPLARGTAVARFAEFRRAGGFVLPHATAWVLDGQPLADERALAVCPDPPGLAPEAFRDPAGLPGCPPGS